VTDAISHQALSGLIGSIYDCTLDPSRWEPALADIMDALDCYAVALTFSDLRDDRLLLHKTVGLAPEEIERAAKHMPEIHALIAHALESGLSPDEPLVMSRHFSPAYVERSPLFQQWERPTGTVDSMRMSLMHTPTLDVGCGADRNERQGLFTDREVEIARLLLPHLRRAVTISNVLDIRTIAGASMAETLDALRCAVVLTNEHGEVMHANRSAERMLSDGAIQISRGVLQAADPSAAAELSAAIALAADNEAAIGKTGLAVRLIGRDGTPLFAHVLPLTGSDFRIQVQPAAVAAVFIGAPPDAQEGAEAVAAAFGLTPAETKVLASLFAGRTLTETAATLGLARTTAKTHVEHIFMKTGVTRQAELMRMWTGLISPARSNGPSMQ
jgi:DNA-binding CsgD family transcriptional regulator/PAS domain-containing protein